MPAPANRAGTEPTANSQRKKSVFSRIVRRQGSSSQQQEGDDKRSSRRLSGPRQLLCAVPSRIAGEEAFRRKFDFDPLAAAWASHLFESPSCGFVQDISELRDDGKLPNALVVVRTSQAKDVCKHYFKRLRSQSGAFDPSNTRLEVIMVDSNTTDESLPVAEPITERFSGTGVDLRSIRLGQILRLHPDGKSFITERMFREAHAAHAGYKLMVFLRGQGAEAVAINSTLYEAATKKDLSSLEATVTTMSGSGGASASNDSENSSSDSMSYEHKITWDTPTLSREDPDEETEVLLLHLENPTIVGIPNITGMKALVDAIKLEDFHGVKSLEATLSVELLDATSQVFDFSVTGPIVVTGVAREDRSSSNDKFEFAFNVQFFSKEAIERTMEFLTEKGRGRRNSELQMMKLAQTRAYLHGTPAATRFEPHFFFRKKTRAAGGSGGEFVDAWARAQEFLEGPIGRGAAVKPTHLDKDVVKAKSIRKLWEAHLGLQELNGEIVVPIVFMSPGGAGDGGHFLTSLSAYMTSTLGGYKATVVNDLRAFAEDDQELSMNLKFDTTMNESLRALSPMAAMKAKNELTFASGLQPDANELYTAKFTFRAAAYDLVSTKIKKMWVGLHMLVLPIETILDAYHATVHLYSLINAIAEAEALATERPHDHELATKFHAAKTALRDAEESATGPLDDLDRLLLRRFIDEELIELGNEDDDNDEDDDSDEEVEEERELTRYPPAFVFLVANGFPTPQSATASGVVFSAEKSLESRGFATQVVDWFVETYKVKASFFPMIPVSDAAIRDTSTKSRPSNQSDAIRGFDDLDRKRYEERAVAGLNAVVKCMLTVKDNELKHWVGAHGRLRRAVEVANANKGVAAKAGSALAAAKRTVARKTKAVAWPRNVSPDAFTAGMQRARAALVATGMRGGSATAILDAARHVVGKSVPPTGEDDDGIDGQATGRR